MGTETTAKESSMPYKNRCNLCRHLPSWKHKKLDIVPGSNSSNIHYLDAACSNDTILDAGGQGSITINGAVLGQASAIVKVSDNVWETQDRQYVLTIVSGGVGSGTGNSLVIGQRTSAGAGSVSGTIRVQGWQEGQLGISLGNTAAVRTLPVYLGDQHAPLAVNASGQLILDAVGNTKYDWSKVQWAANGTLTGGIALANFADVITGSAQADVSEGGERSITTNSIAPCAVPTGTKFSKRVRNRQNISSPGCGHASHQPNQNLARTEPAQSAIEFIVNGGKA